MLAATLIDFCLEEGIDFFTGVPDSFLSALCNELCDRYGVSGSRHLVAHNEGGAIGLCAGHFLASGRPALCYLQNSGLGNALNPLVSLMDEKVYRLPCLLVIGWRGEPGTKDEPQHITQGKITLPLLDLLGIPFRVIGPETSPSGFRDAFSFLLSVLRREKPAALVARKGALTSDLHPDHRGPRSLSREEAAGMLLSGAGAEDLFVCTTGKLSREVFEWREAHAQGHSADFLTVGSMGHAASIALQLAAETSSRRIWCLDGDGALLMHLGIMPLIGLHASGNLIHAVINNGAHETVGGLPVCAGHLNIQGLASAAGYRRVFCAETAEELLRILAILTAPDFRPDGAVLLEIRCSCTSRKDLGRPTTTPLENRNAFMAFRSSGQTDSSVQC